MFKRSDPSLWDLRFISDQLAIASWILQQWKKNYSIWGSYNGVFFFRWFIALPQIHIKDEDLGRYVSSKARLSCMSTK